MRKGGETEKNVRKKKREIIQKKPDCFHMLNSIARVLTNYHHTNKSTFSD
jgi:hypothetical protein